MNEPLKLSPSEAELLIELLQREHDELPVEIHHCRVTSYRDELRRRQDLVAGLLHRMQEPVAV
jgi:hypothetical protein